MGIISKVIVRSRTKGFWFLSLFLITLTAFGQQSNDYKGLPFIANYEPATYEAGIQNWDIIQDDVGRIYIANNLGLLEFDGKFWKRYGLNNTKVRSAFWGKDGRIYVGSQADFGFLSSDETGTLKYTSLADSLPSSIRDFDETWKIFGQNNVVYFCTFKRIYVYDGETVEPINSDKRLDISFQIDNQIYTQITGDGLFLVTLQGFKPIPNGDFFKEIRISNILPYDHDKWLITTFSNGAFLYDGDITPFPLSSEFWKNEYLINYSIRLRNGGIAIGTQNAGLFVIDKDGNLISHIDKGAGLRDFTINFIYEDSQMGLWLAMNNGVARVDLVSPFSVIDDRMGLAGSGYAALKKDDLYYLGTNNGLFIWQNGKAKLVSGTEGQVYSIQNIRGKVVLGHNNGTFLIEGESALPLSSEQGAWILKAIPDHPEYFIQGTYSGLSLFKWQNGELVYVHKIRGFDESSRVMEFDGNILWVAHGYKGVFRVKFNPDFSEVVESDLYNSADGFPNDVLINVHRVANQMIFTANGGFYRYDSEKNYFFPWDEFNDLFGYGTVIADLESDELGNIYFIEQSQLGIIKTENNRQKLHTKAFNKVNRLWNDDLANITVLDNQNILIGGKQGFIHYDPQKDLPREDRPRVLFREILNHGRALNLLFSGHQAGVGFPSILSGGEFSYAQNSFVFEFSSPHFESGDQVQFQVMLENYDANWSPWSLDSRKEYTGLREGKYNFQVRSKTIFGEVSEPISFVFTVKPPIYRSFAAYLFYAITVGVGLYLGFNWLDKRHKAQTKRLENEKNKAIQRKNDEIENLTIRSEEEIMQLKNAKLQAEITFKNQELTSSAMHLIQKNKLLHDIKISLKNLTEEEKNRQLTAQLNRLIKSIDKDLDGGEEWSRFSENFDQVHGNFITRLKEKYPELTPQEIRFSAYLRMNLNTKEIANLLGISVRGVEIGRYRVRKKLGLSRQENLSDFLLRF
ncbi:two component regulator three y domain-containing protein [Algoriphagus boritolerans]|nr:two component regulator three y domain-containing protein [Algoriphagus boritolerans]